MASYKDIFDVAKVKPNKLSEIKQIVDKIIKGRSVYEKISKSLTSTNTPQAASIPWWFIGIVHMNESGGDFAKHLHNGDPLTARTFQVPANRPQRGQPPFTFPQSAIDAIQLMEKENSIWKRLGGDWSIDAVLQRLEAYNGLGYKKKGVPNPYLWSYTDQYTKGKYIKDGVFDPNAISAQPGAAAIMKLLLDYPSPIGSTQSGENVTISESGTGRSEYSDQTINQNTEIKNNLSSDRITKIFDATVIPQQISFDTTNSTQAVNETKNGFGYIPVVYYGAFQIDAEQIDFFTVYNDDMAPAMKLIFTDTLGLMRDKGFPLDDTKITVFINSRSDQLKSIFIQFKIRNFSNSNGLMMIDGVMDVNSLYIKNFASYRNMTSNMAIQQVCREIGLGFNTNIVDTNDRMTWINTGKKNYDFLEEIIDHAYISDESFIAGYIDYYYSFNFVDIQKELSRNVSNDVGIVTTSLEKIFGQKENINDVGPLALTNDASMDGSNIYFSSFRVINDSTAISLSKGYSDNVKFYDLNNKSSLSFKVNSLNNNSDKSILLKGSPQDNTFFNLNQNFVYGGKIDTDNTHKNFKYSPTQNNRNISEAEKIVIEIQLNHPNYNIYRFQKIMLRLAANSKLPSGELINQRLSGDWLISDIRYIYDNKALKQMVTLVKRELELSEDELKNELITNQTSKTGTDGIRGTFENPSTTQAVNNQTSNPQPLSTAARLIGDGVIRKDMTFKEITQSVILNLEGGYFHPDMIKPNSQAIIRVKDPRYSTSGETMFGLDRKAGGPTINACAPCLQFWGLIDAQNAKDKWAWNFIPPDPLKSKLLDLAIQIMEPLFNQSLNLYVPEKEIRDIINSDGRLLFNFVYAQWNGPGWFKGWANQIRAAYKNGKTKSEDLIVLFVEKRVNNIGIIGNNTNNSLISQGGRKIADIVGVNIS
jgi:lysozyme family protein